MTTTVYHAGLNLAVFLPLWEKAKERMKTVHKTMNILRRDQGDQCCMCVIGVLIDVADLGTWEPHNLFSIGEGSKNKEYCLFPKEELRKELVETSAFFCNNPALFASVPSIVANKLGIASNLAQNIVAFNDAMPRDDWAPVIAYIESHIAIAKEHASC